MVSMSGHVNEPTLVLWDVDHTLIENSGVSKMNYMRAFEILVGRPVESRPHTDGRTDLEIMDNLLRAHGVDAEEYRAQFVDVLEQAMRENDTALRERGFALAGAEEALDALARESSIVQSVLTGNIPYNARAKLAAFGLDALLDFEVGGYGTDSSVRSELVPAAQRRAREKYGLAYDGPSTILVGDTVRDVRAGLDGGARVIAVASGEDSVDTLRESGAQAVLHSLEDTARFVDAVKEVRST
jgi:phosphoglycolate phosphatase-like HAD superfamily hydrolase